MLSVMWLIVQVLFSLNGKQGWNGVKKHIPLLSVHLPIYNHSAIHLVCFLLLHLDVSEVFSSTYGVIS